LLFNFIFNDFALNACYEARNHLILCL
jgi:hypothetical protein